MTSQYAQAVVDGVLSGGVYALMAAGLTLIFGVMDVINIAQGVMIVLGAYLSYALSVHLGLDLFATLVVTVPTLFVVGVAVEWVFMRRLAERDRTAMSILVTYAVAIIIEGILIQVFGPDFVQLHGPYVDKSVHVLGFYLPYIYIYGFMMLAVVLLGLLYALLYLTRFGQALRASLQDRRAAELIGIEVNKVRTITFGIGVAVTAAGGMVFGATNAFNPKQRLRPHLPAPDDRHSRWPRLHRRCAGRRRLHARGRGRGSRRHGRRPGRRSSSSPCS